MKSVQKTHLQIEIRLNRKQARCLDAMFETGLYGHTLDELIVRVLDERFQEIFGCAATVTGKEKSDVAAHRDQLVAGRYGCIASD